MRIENLLEARESKTLIVVRDQISQILEDYKKIILSALGTSLTVEGKEIPLRNFKWWTGEIYAPDNHYELINNLTYDLTIYGGNRLNHNFILEVDFAGSKLYIDFVLLAIISQKRDRKIDHHGLFLSEITLKEGNIGVSKSLTSEISFRSLTGTRQPVALQPGKWKGRIEAALPTVLKALEARIFAERKKSMKLFKSIYDGNREIQIPGVDNRHEPLSKLAKDFERLSRQILMKKISDDELLAELSQIEEKIKALKKR